MVVNNSNGNNITLKVLEVVNQGRNRNNQINSMLKEYTKYLNATIRTYTNNKAKIYESPRDPKPTSREPDKYKLMISAYQGGKMVGYLFAKQKGEPKYAALNGNNKSLKIHAFQVNTNRDEVHVKNNGIQFITRERIREKIVNEFKRKTIGKFTNDNINMNIEIRKLFNKPRVANQKPRQFPEPNDKEIERILKAAEQSYENERRRKYPTAKQSEIELQSLRNAIAHAKRKV